MKRSSMDQIRENLRLQQVYNLLLRYGWEMAIFDRPGGLGNFRRRMQAWVWDLPEELESIATPTKVRLMLEELGPTYVKMGQIVSSQSSALPMEWQRELDLLQSNVPPFPSSQVREIILAELKATPEELYAAFSPEPFAAASTAQVHKAVLHDGTEVAVKVQRPNIYNQMKADIGIMQNAARVISARSDWAKSIDLSGMLDQFGSSVLAELDYTGEAYNALRLTQSMATIPGVRLPHIYPELSTSRVITMEFVKGVKISNLEAIDKAGIDRATLAHNTTAALIKQLLIDGFFHADPHPGNVLVNTQTGDVTFIDTGMVGELDVQQRLNLVQLLVAVQASDIDSMGEILRNMSVPYVENVDQAGYKRAFQRRIGHIFFSSGGSSFADSVNVGMELLNEYGMRLNPNLTMAVKALVQVEAITTLLYPAGGITTEGVALVQEMFLKTATPERITEEVRKQAMTVGREFLKRLPNLSDATLKWLDQYQAGSFNLTLDTSQLATELVKVRTFGRQVVIAIILVGLIIGSAIATSAVQNITPGSEPYPQVWQFLYKLAYIGYIIPVIIGIIMVLVLVWRWIQGKPPE